MKAFVHTLAFLAFCPLIGCGGGGLTTTSNPTPAPVPAPPGPGSGSGPGPTAAEALYGKWSTLPYLMPVNPIHAALLDTGKVLIVSGSGNDPNNAFPINTTPNYRASMWDPQSGKITTQSLDWDMFCNGMSVMPDGRVLINGGTAAYGALAVVGGAPDVPFTGLPNSSIFDPATESFSPADGPTRSPNSAMAAL